MRKSIFPIVLLLFIFGCVEELETENSSNKEKQIDNHINLFFMDEINDIDLKNNVTKNLTKLKALFPTESIDLTAKARTHFSTSSNETTLQKIEINTDVFAEVRNEKGTPSYTFEVELPGVATSSKGKINLHTYYDENNQLKSNLIRYDLTPDEFVTAINNKSYDGFWDKIYHMELSDVEETEDMEVKEPDNDSIQEAKKLSIKSSAFAKKCKCKGGGSSAPVPKWTPFPPDSGYVGSSASGIGYILPPLNTLPYHVIASLKAAGVFTGSYTIGISGHSSPVNHTQPVLTFSVRDIRIPRNTTGSSYVPFQYFYPYKMAGLKNTINEYYKKVYVSQINSYITSEKTTIIDHAKKQSYITQFFYFMHELKEQTPASYEYLEETPNVLKSLFYFLEEGNEIYDNFNKRKDFAKAAVVALENGGEVDFENRLIYDPTLDQDYLSLMAKKEKEIFDSLTNYQKTQYLMSAQQAWKYAEIHYLESFYNGNGDAVRHAFWNALATVRLGEALTKKLTDAHESDPFEADYPNQYKERDMDLFNNNVGREIASKSGRLFQLIEEALKSGNLRKLSNLAPNRRATDTSQLIPTN
jgi:hypothetical protein